MKKILTLFLLLTAFVAVQAQNAMVLSMKDGSKNVVYIKAPES